MIIEHRIGEALIGANYVFAKTMPNNPHWYTVVKTWPNKALFYDTVQYIRDHGVIEMFWKKPYTVFFMNGHKYWTMGAPISETILINRKDHAEPAAYDDAFNYEELFSTAEAAKEEEVLFSIIGKPKTGQTVLEIGCGYGMFLRHNPQISPWDYRGIDPSVLMLEKFKANFPGFQTIHTKFENLYYPKVDRIYALFGSASYIDPSDRVKAQRMLKPGGQAVLMYYSEEYRRCVQTHLHCGIKPETFEAPAGSFKFGNYIIEIIEA